MLQQIWKYVSDNVCLWIYFKHNLFLSVASVKRLYMNLTKLRKRKNDAV